MSNITAKLDDMLVSLEDLGTEIQSNIDRLDAIQGAERQQLEATIENQISDYQNIMDKVSRSMKVLKTSKEYYEQELNNNAVFLSEYSAKLKQKRLLNNQSQSVSLKSEQNLAKTQNVTSNLSQAIDIGRATLQTSDSIHQVLLNDGLILENINKNLDSTDKLAGEGKAIADRMKRRQICISAISWIIVFLLVIALGVSVYLKFFRK